MRVRITGFSAPAVQEFMESGLKAQLEQLLERAVGSLVDAGELPEQARAAPVKLERPRESAHGDLACNLALVLAKPAGRKPRELAEALVAAMPDSTLLERTEIAGPGFINFFLAGAAVAGIIEAVLEAGAAYGRSDAGAGQRVQVEFVSANPTGPLHIGHGRGAAYGAAVAGLLEATGHEVQREYYVNDAGRQMAILAFSVWLRYRNLFAAEPAAVPRSAYRGDYVAAIARALRDRDGEAYRIEAAPALAGALAALERAENGAGDAEAALDAAVAALGETLGRERFAAVHEFAAQSVLEGIRADLARFGVTYDNWFSEAGLFARGAVARTVERLEGAGKVYERDGARWFRSTDYGDEKDRVLVRENGQSTYFAGDCAYHADKLERGFDRLVNIWGADHHGYVPRVRAALQALGYEPERLEVRLVQFATLYRGEERLQMSTRSGEFVTLAALLEEVGTDAARFFYVMRKAEQHLEFDLELAKSRTSENPVYYVQYAHARICSVFAQLAEKGLTFEPAAGEAAAERLELEHEAALIAAIARYPETVAAAAAAREPHQIAYYLRDLAHAFHTYYNAAKIIAEDDALRQARLALAAAVRVVVANGLGLLGVSAPESM